MFVIVAMFYLLLCCPITLCAHVGMDGLNGNVSLEAGYPVIGLRLDGILRWDAKALRLRLLRRYAQPGAAKKHEREKQTPAGQMKKKPGRLRRAKAMFRAVLASGTLHVCDTQMRMGLADADKTALLAGGCRAGLSAALFALGVPGRVQVIPAFGSVCFVLDARCIFSASPGNMMMAAAKAAWNMRWREGFTWKNTPSKA